MITGAIATRMLRSALGEVRVTLFAPEPVGDDMCCHYSIEGPRLRRAAQAYGVDGFQAIDLALRMIGIDLRLSEEFKAGPLTWLDLEEPGFPLPESCADLSWGQP